MKKLILAALLVATPAYALVQVGDKIDVSNHIICEYAETMEMAIEAYNAEGEAGALAIWKGSIAMGQCSKAMGGVTVLEVHKRYPGLAIVRTDHANHSYTITRDHP